MNEPRVPCIIIDKERREAYLENGYNPPKISNETERSNYADEWWRASDKVKDAVSQYWTHGFGDEDFFIDIYDWVPDRFLCIEVSNEEMLGQKLLATVHEIVSSLDPDYSVDICDAWGFLKTKDGKEFPHFNIFVEKDQILVYSESKILLKRLGLLGEEGSK